ncbi:hypothetical protein HQ590_05540 [bacterium]|nr:hypothetical protein [bacterium]
MTFARTTLMALAACAAIAMAGPTARADTYEHLDGLAFGLQRQAAELYHDFGAHFRHTAEYQHLASDAARMYHLAAHMHEVAHQRGGIQHLQSDLSQIDRNFHHLGGVVWQLASQASQPSGGHIHGDVRHAYTLMNQMKSTLHHLKADVDQLVYAAYGGHGGHGGSGHPGQHGSPGIGLGWGNGRVYLNGNGLGIRFGG